MKIDSLTLDKVLTEIAVNNKDKTAIIFDGKNCSYNELYEKSYNLSVSLFKLGIRKGDRVAILLSNRVEYFYVYFALFLIGAWAVPISTRYEKDEIKNVLQDSGVCTIIYEKKIGIFNYVNILSELEPDLPELKNHILVSDDKAEDEKISFKNLLQKSELDEETKKSLSMQQPEPDDVALLAYTSGTTGTPKGVMIPHRTLVITSADTTDIWDLGNDITFSVAPLYAAQGFILALIYLIGGSTMKWISTFNPNDIARELATKNFNVFHTQPTMWTLLLTLPFFEHLDFDHITKVIVSGSLCPVHLAEKIEEKMGCTLLNGYGLIEATGAVALTRLDDPADVRYQTVGSAIGGVEMKVVDENRNEVAKGEVGELAIRGFLMNGYYNKPEKTGEVIDEEGWLYSGDMAKYHDDKNISIVGRCKDMVIRGGFNVYPIDIEECLLKNESIEDIAVVGKDDDILGEKLVAFVIPKPFAALTESDVKKFCRGKIANYKIPDDVHFVAEFPILLSGKVKKNELRDWANNGIPDESQILFNT